MSLFFLLNVVRVFSNPEHYQWDFSVYYLASRDFNNGLNPYAKEYVPSKSDGPVKWVYAYPPYTLYLFQFLTVLDFKTAYRVYLIVKILLFIGLLLLWQKIFLLKSAWEFIFFTFCLFSFYACALIDFYCGNISILEQFFLWFAFYFFLQSRYLLFSIFIFAAAFFKGLPILFLSLLFYAKIPDYRMKIFHFLLTPCLFLSIVGISYQQNPTLYKNFTKNISRVSQESGVIEPSSLQFFKSIDSRLCPGSVTVLPFFLYGIFACAVLFCSLYSLHKFLMLNKEGTEKVIIMLSCFTFALCAPRFKDYSYILLILPAYYLLLTTNFFDWKIMLFFLIPRSDFSYLIFLIPCYFLIPTDRGFDGRFLLFFLVLIAHQWKIPALSGFVTFFFSFYPFFLSLFLWVYFIYRLEKLDKTLIILQEH
ncbi:glycosyltransferase 87 family protein [Candidatus Riflebacteria bacterium]